MAVGCGCVRSCIEDDSEIGPGLITPSCCVARASFKVDLLYELEGAIVKRAAIRFGSSAPAGFCVGSQPVRVVSQSTKSWQTHLATAGPYTELYIELASTSPLGCCLARP